jgi:hypothetical protein
MSNWNGTDEQPLGPDGELIWQTPPDTQGAGYGELPAQVYSDEEGGLPREFLEFAKFLENNPPMEKREVSVRMIRAVATAIQTLTAENERNRAGFEFHAGNGEKLHARIAELEAEVAARDEALIPSGDTKADYMGEFKFDVMVPDIDEDNDELVPMQVYVPWTTIKEIMAAIRARAFLARNTDGGGK